MAAPRPDFSDLRAVYPDMREHGWAEDVSGKRFGFDANPEYR